MAPPSLHSSRVQVHTFLWRSRDFRKAVYHSKVPFCFYRSWYPEFWGFPSLLVGRSSVCEQQCQSGSTFVSHMLFYVLWSGAKFPRGHAYIFGFGVAWTWVAINSLFLLFMNFGPVGCSKNIFKLRATFVCNSKTSLLWYAAHWFSDPWYVLET